MGFLLRIVGFGLLILGIYLVGENIFFTTNVYPYWWRGISADISVLALTSGVLWPYLLAVVQFLTLLVYGSFFSH